MLRTIEFIELSYFQSRLTNQLFQFNDFLLNQIFASATTRKNVQPDVEYHKPITFHYSNR